MATFRDIELKLFHKLGDLFDLRAVLVKNYSPNRAEVALRQFRGMLTAVRKGGFVQPKLDLVVSPQDLDDLTAEFFGILTQSAHPCCHTVAAGVINSELRRIFS